MKYEIFVEFKNATPSETEVIESPLSHCEMRDSMVIILEQKFFSINNSFYPVDFIYAVHCIEVAE